MNFNFASRHIGPSQEETNEMLHSIGVKSLEEMIQQAVPDNIKLKNPIGIGQEISEYQFLRTLKEVAEKNKLFRSYLGLGYNNTITPGVILRNIFENPGWYTQYTPYQAEISQGRLEALLNYQTMVVDLTGLSNANASLLDEATAAAEAMYMLYDVKNKKRKTRRANYFYWTGSGRRN